MIIKLKSWYSAYSETHSTLLFALLMRLLACVLLIAGTFEFIPAWILRDAVDQVHLWHIAELTALATFLLGSITFVLSFRPETKPLLALFVVSAITVLAVGIMPFDRRGIALLPVAFLLLVTYPRRRVLPSLHPEGSISIALLTITFLFAVFLIPRTQQEISWQILGMLDGDSHAQFLHWIGSALLFVLLILAGGFSATKRPGWKTLAVGTGVTYCYLGVTAMLIPYYAGSWGETGEFFSILGGILYILFMSQCNGGCHAADAATYDDGASTCMSLHTINILS